MTEYLCKARAFIQSTFAKDVAKVGGGAAIGQIIVFGASPILTRIYTPEEFGVLAVFSAIIGILFAALAGRYEVAIPIPKSDHTAMSVAVLGFGIVFLVSGSAGLVLYVWKDTFIKLTNTPALGPYVWLIPVGLLGAGIYAVLNYWAIRRKAYTVVARTKISQNVARVVSQLGFGLYGAGAVGLLIGEILGRVGGVGSLATFAFREDRRLLRTVTTSKIRQAARRFQRFPLLAGPSALMNTASLRLPELLFASLFMPSVAGWFALAQRVISVPTWLVSQAIHQVYLGEASQLARTSPGELRTLFLKVSGLLAVIGVIPALGLWGFGSAIFPVIFGENWSQAGGYAESLSIAFAGQIIVSPLSMTLNILERQELQLAWDTGRFTVVLGVLGSGSLWELTADDTVFLYSAFLCLTYGLLWFLCLYAIGHQQMIISAKPAGKE